MEEKILRRIAVLLSILAILVCSSIFYFPKFAIKTQDMLISYKEWRSATEAQRLGMSGLELLEYNNRQAKKNEKSQDVTFDSQLRLELPLGVTGDELEITESYVTQTIDITIPFADKNYFYDHPMLGSSDHIDALTYESMDRQGVVEIVTSEVFELKTSYDEHYLYIDFLTPQELYDKVVVIDAGHGGAAPGATKQGVNEKDIDLDIVLELKQLFDDANDPSIGVYYTRTDDTNPRFEDRVGLANKSHANLFISIHNNATQSGRMSSINGTQVMYDETKADEPRGTKELAQICLEEVTTAIGSSNKGLVEGNDIYIIRSSEVPVSLIEVGFMTNQQELNHLKSEEYQKKIAQGIYNAIMRAFAEGF